MDEKKCIDCIHFREYYTKQINRFYKTGMGFCVNHKTSGHKRKADKVCECYNQRDTKTEKEKRLKYLNDYLAGVALRLSELKEVLTEDN